MNNADDGDWALQTLLGMAMTNSVYDMPLFCYLLGYFSHENYLDQCLETDENFIRGCMLINYLITCQ